MVFKSLQDIVRKYRGKCEEDGSDDEEESGDEEQPMFASAAHYDVLAESITKLVSVRPTEYTQDRKFAKQEMVESVQFVDYDKIDIVEQEDEDLNTMVGGGQDDLDPD